MKKIVTLFLSLSLVFAVGCGNVSATSIRFGSAAVGGMYSAFANAYTQIVSQDDESLQFSVPLQDLRQISVCFLMVIFRWQSHRQI